jgi:integrase
MLPAGNRATPLTLESKGATVSKNTHDPSRRKAQHRKPKATGKSGADFPLKVHKGTGRWIKKIRGVVYYFTTLAEDPSGVEAHERYLKEKDDLENGRGRAQRDDRLTVAELANRFLEFKSHLRDTGELRVRTFNGYYWACDALVHGIGKTRTVESLTPDDFGKLRIKLAKTKKGEPKSAVALRNEMQRVRSIFKFAHDQGLIPAPVRFGQSFQKPKPDVIRRARAEHRAKHGDRMLEASELRAILEDVKDQPALRAMVLLACNTGFGQTDLSSLPRRCVDLDKGIVDFARPKTGIERRIPLWPETTDAIRAYLKHRPKAKRRADAEKLFLTRCGSPWVKLSKSRRDPTKKGAGGNVCDALGGEFSKALVRLGIKRARVGFYSLRHGFETIAGETADQVAVDAVMGHVPQGMSAEYRERVGADRIFRVVQHVRRWLFGQAPESTGIGPDPAPTLPLPSAHAPSKSEATGPALRIFAG